MNKLQDEECYNHGVKHCTICYPTLSAFEHNPQPQRTYRIQFRAQTIDDLQDEATRAFKKHEDNTFFNPEMSILVKLAGLGEEYGEVCEAMIYDNPKNRELAKELLQVSNLALAWYQSIMYERPANVVSNNASASTVLGNAGSSRGY